MTLDELITQFARNNGIERPEPNNGCYRIPLEGVAIDCFMEADKVCLLADIAPLPRTESQQQSQSRLLLEKTMGLIQEQRCALMVDGPSQRYQIYQRLPLKLLRLEDFQEAVEKMGGCGLYYKGILGVVDSGDFSAPSGNMMMP